MSTLSLFHSIEKPWFRRKFVTDDARATLMKVIPIQHILQAVNLNHTGIKPSRLGWHTLLHMRHNVDQLSTLASFTCIDDPDEMREIRSQVRRARFWIGAAKIARLLQYLIPPFSSMIARRAIDEYQILCVISRTCCEATLPELIELFTELV